MSQNNVVKSKILPAALISLAVGLTLASCGGRSSDSQSADSATAADTARDEQIKAREDELAKREADLAAKEKEQDVARQQAEEAAQKEREAAEQTAAAKKAAASAAAKAAAAKKAAPVASASSAATKPAPAPKPVPKPIDVPAGTQLTVALSQDLTSKTAKVGDPFEASLVSDLMVGSRVAIPAGTRVTGTVTDVISGSKAIGAIPTIGLKFDSLALRNGQQIPIRGELKEQGKSEKGQDTAKILGGAAAGAILGHQVKKGSGGKVIGGLLGGAVGAVAAKKTGSEVKLAAGSTLTIALGEGFTVTNP